MAERLTREGHRVRGLVRDPDRAPACLAEVVTGDAVTGRGLTRALDGADVAYTFVHALERGTGTSDIRDVFAALEFARAARASGLARAVFFSIFMPPDGTALTRYQANRLAVEKILLDGFSGTVVLRSGISLGSGLRGIRPYLRLIQRLPVLPLGPWRRNVAAVVDLDTELNCLLAAATRDGLTGRAWGTPTSAQPTHEQLLRALADVLGLRRAIVGLPLASERLDAHLIAAITVEDRQLCDYLVGATRTDYRCDPALTAPFDDITPMALHDALTAAVTDWRELPRYAPAGGTK